MTLTADITQGLLGLPYRELARDLSTGHLDCLGVCLVLQQRAGRKSTDPWMQVLLQLREGVTLSGFPPGWRCLYNGPARRSRALQDLDVVLAGPMLERVHTAVAGRLWTATPATGVISRPAGAVAFRQCWRFEEP